MNKLTDPFEINGYVDNAIDLIYINTTDKQRERLLELATYNKAFMKTPTFVRGRAHVALKKVANKVGVDLNVANNVYERILAGLLDKVWNTLTEDSQYRKLYRLKVGNNAQQRYR